MRFKNYEEALDFMYKQLPMYSRVGASALRLGLGNITALCEALGNPQNKLKCIHIAGSNGKGSVSHMLSGTLQEAGYKVGLYTSPHLVDLRERFRIDGALVDKHFVIDFLNQHFDIIEVIKPSYFEINVAMAFDFFEKLAVDYVVVETGLGGRLDSTNIIDPILSVITNISLEHTAILGDTLDKIAYEKAGIIKPNRPVVIGESHADTRPVFFTKAVQCNSSITFADDQYDIVRTEINLFHQSFNLIDLAHKNVWQIETDLLGDYQSKNIITAFAAVNQLIQVGIINNEQPFIEALKNIKNLTGLRGRWEVIQRDPTIIIDVAHNPAGMEFFRSQAQHLNASGKVYVILGCANDKDVNTVLEKLPSNIELILTQASVLRAMDIQVLSQYATEKGWSFNSFENVSSAIDYAQKLLQEEDILIITGSFFIVADALDYLKL